MEKTFEPAVVETRWRDLWVQSGWQKPSGNGPPFSMVIPPPNVTGTLHMGHAFQHTIMDALVRYHRMKGDRTLWQPGTDHAGIATQMVVERNLARDGVSRRELGRQKFVDAIWQWKNTSHQVISDQIRRMGSSVDWSRERFTMDDEYSRAVIEHFVRLHDAGLIYRGKRLVNWDPVLQTAISDLEVIQEEEDGKLWYLRYPLTERPQGTAHPTSYLVVATTRPETMLGDTAVAVHSDDERYQGPIGSSVRLPLCDRDIPVIGDPYVDREFGTGVLKITPAHDFHDYVVGERHNLPLRNILDPTGKLNDQVPKRYRGLDRFEARQRIVEDLQTQGLVEKIEDHKLNIPRGDRTGAVLEPYLTDQWFVDLTRVRLQDGRPGGWTAITEPAIRVVEKEQVRFVPDSWRNTYFHWLNNIQDWCISRQLWWGHRIPAWYDDDGNVYVARNEIEARKKYRIPQELRLTQDSDVFDTWFSSDIWPMATLGWPEESSELAQFYPTNVLVTGFDIIFFWVARMIMMGLYFRGKAPFSEVFITGLVRDPDGNKMSKSRGNILDPLDVVDGISLDALIEKRTQNLVKPETAPVIAKKTRDDYPHGINPVGVDALRFTFASLATNGRDIRFDANRAEGYRNFCNKLWNASRFVLMHCESENTVKAAGIDPTFSEADRWIVSRLQRVEADVANHFSNYRFDLLAQVLYEFVWNEYCDWYLELAKVVLQLGSGGEQAGARQTLVRTLETILRLLHPIMPYITEDIWQRIAPLLSEKTGQTIMLQPYPAAQLEKIDQEAEGDIEWLKTFTLGVRQIRGELSIPPGKKLPVLLHHAGELDRDRVQRLKSSILWLARIDSIQLLDVDSKYPECAAALLGEMRILVPLAGLVDKEAELARLNKMIGKIKSDLAKNEVRLANNKFLESAPVAIVERERSRVAQQHSDLNALEAQMERIRTL